MPRIKSKIVTQPAAPDEGGSIFDFAKPFNFELTSLNPMGILDDLLAHFGVERSGRVAAAIVEDPARTSYLLDGPSGQALALPPNTAIKRLALYSMEEGTNGKVTFGERSNDVRVVILKQSWIALGSPAAIFVPLCTESPR